MPIFIGRGAEGCEVLGEFLRQLKSDFPDLIFTNDAELCDEFSSPTSDWFARADAGTIWNRL